MKQNRKIRLRLKPGKVDKKQLKAQIEANRWARRSFWVALIGVLIPVSISLIPATHIYVEKIFNTITQKKDAPNSHTSGAENESDELSWLSVHRNGIGFNISEPIKKNHFSNFRSTLNSSSRCNNYKDEPLSSGSGAVKVSWYCANDFTKWYGNRDHRYSLPTREQLDLVKDLKTDKDPDNTETQWTIDCVNQATSVDKCIEFYVYGGVQGLRANPNSSGENVFRIVKAD